MTAPLSPHWIAAELVAFYRRPEHGWQWKRDTLAIWERNAQDGYQNWGGYKLAVERIKSEGVKCS